MTEYEKLINNLIAEDEALCILTAENKAALRTIPDLIGKNFIDVGIAEQSLVGISAGMATRKRKPIAHALAAFLTMRAFEFIRTDIGYPNLPVKLVGSFSGFLSTSNGPTHQAIEDVGIMSCIPNMSVCCPADYDDMLKCLPELLSHNGPVYIRFNDIQNRFIHSSYKFGKAELVFEGKDVMILTYGTLFNQAYKSITLLRNLGINAGLINLRTIKPLDRETILSQLDDVSLIVTLEDHLIESGLYSLICRLFVENEIRIPVLPIGLKNKWFKPLPLDELIEYEGFSAKHITEKIIDKFKK